MPIHPRVGWITVSNACGSGFSGGGCGARGGGGEMSGTASLLIDDTDIVIYRTQPRNRHAKPDCRKYRHSPTGAIRGSCWFGISLFYHAPHTNAARKNRRRLPWMSPLLRV